MATAVLAVAVENRVPTRAEFTALLVLTSGVMIAVWEGAKGSLRGICFASLGMLSNAVRLGVLNKHWPKQADALL